MQREIADKHVPPPPLAACVLGACVAARLAHRWKRGVIRLAPSKHSNAVVGNSPGQHDGLFILPTNDSRDLLGEATNTGGLGPEALSSRVRTVRINGMRYTPLRPRSE